MPRIAFLITSALADNPYRDIAILRSLKGKGVEVAAGMAARPLEPLGFGDEWRDDPAFAAEGVIWIEDCAALDNLLDGADVFLFGTCKNQTPLIDLAKARGLPVVGYQSMGGFNFWHAGLDRGCVPGPLMARKIAFLYGENDLTVTGSLAHRIPEGLPAVPGRTPLASDRDAFFARYHLDPARPLGVLFPKGIQSLHAKVPSWFRDWTPAQCLEYEQRIEGIYARILDGLVAAGWNAAIKMHPSSNRSYRCDRDEEYAYWSRFGLPVLETEDAYNAYRHLDLGLGVSTHSALDVNYFGKPFLYVDTLDVPLIPTKAAYMSRYCALPRGPSEGWAHGGHASEFWLPAWVGRYCTSPELGAVLADPATLQVPSDAHRTFIAEFWHSTEADAADSIAEEALKMAAGWTTAKRLGRRLTHGLGRVGTAARGRMIGLLARCRRILSQPSSSGSGL